MDEALEVVDVVADSGFEGIAAALIALLGVIAVLAGLGLLLLTDMLLVPALLVVIGIVLIIAPGVGLVLAEFA